MGNKRQIEYKGNIYKSLTDLAKAYDKSIKTVRNRVDNLGWSLEKALEKPVINKPRDKQQIEYKGNIYNSLTDLAKAYDKSITIVKARMNNLGWSLEKALEEPINNKPRNKQVEYKGKKYDSLTDLAKAYGKSITTVRSRIEKLGWNIEKALEEPVNKQPRNRGNSKKIRYKNKIYNSVTELADALNIDRHHLYNEIFKGRDIHKIIEVYSNKSYN